MKYSHVNTILTYGEMADGNSYFNPLSINWGKESGVGCPETAI
jgi:hypothetical protein